MRTLVVLPTYQEAANVAIVLERLRELVPEAHVLVVDDNSPDGTADVAGAVATRVGGIEVLRRAGKWGLGSAYCAGFSVALSHGYGVVVQMDADLSHDPAAVPELLGALDTGVDLVLGSRYVPGGEIPDWSWWRRALSRCGNRYAAAVLGLDVLDATSGFRVYRADALRRIDLPSVRAEGYAFQIEMTYRLAARGGRIVEWPIRFTERGQGNSKLSARIIAEALVLVTWWGGRDLLRRLLTRTATKPARASGSRRPSPQRTAQRRSGPLRSS